MASGEKASGEWRLASRRVANGTMRLATCDAPFTKIRPTTYRSLETIL